nr:3-hydroxyacid dehydrogenase [uncultured Gammaproteobacteria bacterium]BAL55751.1 3-hydroxyacid dehydrogenase [uncultured Gammaproteobacteria bacterium]
MTETKPTLAWLGTGLMGRSMAERLLAQGYSLWVWNRTRAKAQALAAHGAKVAATPAEAVANSQLVFTMLADFAATAAVLQEIDLSGKTLVQMATIAPDQSQELANRVERAGGAYLEAPVLGSTPEARAGALIVMVGGQEDRFLKLYPILANLGPKPRRIGEVGKASALKLALNQLIATLTAAFAISLAFVQEHQVEVEVFMEILRQSALYAPTFDKKLGRMRAHDYQNPNFPIEHLIKDIHLFRQATETLDVSLIEAVQNLYARASAGHRREDYSCVFEAVEKR